VSACEVKGPVPIRRSTPIERATRLESGQVAAIRVPALAADVTNVVSR